MDEYAQKFPDYDSPGPEYDEASASQVRRPARRGSKGNRPAQARRYRAKPRAKHNAYQKAWVASRRACAQIFPSE